MPTHLIALALLLLAATACTAPEDDTASLEEGTAAVLAHQAERLAVALEGDDECTAVAEADTLTAQAHAGLDSDEVPLDVVREVEAVAGEITQDLSCDRADDADTDEGGEPQEESGEPQEEGGDGQQPADDAVEASGPDDDREDDRDKESGDQDDSASDRGGGEGPQGEGPDGEGPPGHRDEDAGHGGQGR